MRLPIHPLRFLKICGRRLVVRLVHQREAPPRLADLFPAATCKQARKLWQVQAHSTSLVDCRYCNILRSYCQPAVCTEFLVILLHAGPMDMPRRHDNDGTLVVHHGLVVLFPVGVILTGCRHVYLLQRQPQFPGVGVGGGRYQVPDGDNLRNYLVRHEITFRIWPR